jgi:hypothetical protein
MYRIRRLTDSLDISSNCKNTIVSVMCVLCDGDWVHMGLFRVKGIIRGFVLRIVRGSIMGVRMICFRFKVMAN